MAYLFEMESKISAIEVSVLDHEHATVRPVQKKKSPFYHNLETIYTRA